MKKFREMKAIAAFLIVFPAIPACSPTNGADPLDSSYNTMPVVEALSEKSGNSFRGEYGMEATAEF